MLLKGVIEFPKVPNYQSRTQKLLLLNNGLFTANVLSAMILSDTNKIVLFEMAQLTTDQRVFIVENFLETGSINDVKALFRATFPERNVPSMSTIQRNVEKYHLHGTSLNRNKGNSGRPKTVTARGNVEEVRRLLEQNPHVSARRNGLGLSHTSFNRITRSELHFYPYRIKVRHQLQEGDFQRRERFCEWFLQQWRNRRLRGNFVISDEAAFHMNGKVNTRNVREYAPRGNAPDFHYDVNNSRAKLNVWVGMCSNGVLLGPHFFEGHLNGIKYHDILVENAFPELMDHFREQFEDNHFRYLNWAQDGAPTHRSHLVRDLLLEMFQDRVIAQDQPTEWPPRSPDLTPCDFFLWGFVKGNVFTTPPASIEDMRDRIVNELANLREDPETMKRVFRDMQRRAELCIERGGRHVEGH